MEYDFRSGSYTFKHIIDAVPTPSNEKFQEHFHTTYELLYFIDGHADFMIQHKLYKLKPHSLLVIKPGELHNLVIKADRRYERIVVQFDGAQIPVFLREKIDLLEKVYALKNTFLSDELFHLDRHYENIDLDMRMYTFLGALQIILTYLCSGNSPSLRPDYANEEIASIMAYIDEHLTSIHTIDEVCRALHLSPSTLKRMFYDYCHTSVMSYIRTQKCMRAHNLLNNGLSPSQVCEACGFSDYSTFYRAYLSIFGYSPSKR